jgi:hypothetical protein
MSSRDLYKLRMEQYKRERLAEADKSQRGLIPSYFPPSGLLEPQATIPARKPMFSHTHITTSYITGKETINASCDLVSGRYGGVSGSIELT